MKKIPKPISIIVDGNILRNYHFIYENEKYTVIVFDNENVLNTITFKSNESFSDFLFNIDLFKGLLESGVSLKQIIVSIHLHESKNVLNYNRLQSMLGINTNTLFEC